MKPNASVLTLVGAVTLAALTGITFACSQSSPPSPSGVSSSNASPPVSQSPISAPLATATPTPTNPVAQPQVTERSPDQVPATVNRTVESCVLRMARVNDPNPPLNVRSSPTTEGDNVVGQLKNGTFVTVATEQNGWLQIKTPMKGWVSKPQTDTGCNDKVERINLKDSSATVQVSDRFIGTGSHRYLVSGSKGQTFTITRDRGPFPLIVSPDGKILLGHESDEARQSWSTQLDQTGDYTLELESNFKGYKYSFSIEAKGE